MNILKKNQIIIYTFALMLVAAGYLNYTSTLNKNDVETSVEEVVNEENQIADIGDAKLVNSNDIVSQNDNNSNNDNNNDNSDNNSDNDSSKASSISTEENILDKSNKSEETSSNINSDDYFVQSKLERDTMYSQMIENY